MMEDDRYKKILMKIEALKRKQELDNYLNNKAFLAETGLSKDMRQFDELNEIIQIIKYFPNKEKEQLKLRLEKIKSKYVGQRGILYYIFARFSCEGRHISIQELYCLINSIIDSCIDNRKEQNTFCWIVAAHAQRNWIDELILLQLENHFKRPLEEKCKWQQYLSKIENKEVLLLFTVRLDQCGAISTQCIDDTLRLLSSISKAPDCLEGLELSEWPYVLKEEYWSCRLTSLVNLRGSNKLPTASYYLLSVENYFGIDLVEELLNKFENYQQNVNPDVLTEILANFHNGKWNLSREEIFRLEFYNVENWVNNMKQKFAANNEERKIMHLVELIKGNANTSRGILKNLPRIKIDIEAANRFPVIFNSRSFLERDIYKIIALIDDAIKQKRGFKLRDTQKLAVLALYTNDQNTLAQVSTGEGKSLIVVAVAIMKALQDEKVDVITSSSVLAIRDAEENRDIYSLFNINVSHNCSEDIEKRKQAYSSSQVVYGELSSFQRDYLLDKFYGKNVLGDRNFKNVIVDEVDSMLLDNGNNMLYLSHDIAGLDKLESVYIYIWQWLNRPDDIFLAFDTKEIEKAVLRDLYGFVTKEHIGRLGSELTELQRNNIWKSLVKAKILDNEGKLLKENIDDIKLIEILSPELSSYKESLYFLLMECVERDRSIHVPNYLRSFVEMHLEAWIKSARTAYFMKPGQDYVVDVDRTGTNPDRNANIVIIDRDTGTDQANSQWDEALHQFLQLKHGCKLSLQSLKAVFISNVSFFKLYSKLFGLTGTLGSQRERDLLREIHDVGFVTNPTAKVKRFEEFKPILCSSKDEWINHIRDEAKIFTQEKKRSVLIICETVNDVEALYKALEKKSIKNIHMYKRDYQEFDIAQGNTKLQQGQIIIATNLAGRGTDIKPSEGLRKAGGLHVCLTYLAGNIRIEEQAFGRAARSGDDGSGRLIIMDSKGQKYSNSRILDLKKQRDADELQRLAKIKFFYETEITTEERCFEAFKKQYERLKKSFEVKGVPSEVKQIILQSCLDKWAFWLDENSKYIQNLKDKQNINQFNKKLDKLIDHFVKFSRYNVIDLLQNSIISPLTLFSSTKYDMRNWIDCVEGNPAQMVKLAKYFSQNKHPELAIQQFDEVINNEPHFSEAAHYYKAFALTKTEAFKQRNKQTMKEFKSELHKTSKLLDAHSRFAVNAAGIIGTLRKNNPDSILQIDAFEEQQKCKANLYYMFSQSIDDIFGHGISLQSFANHEISQELSDTIYRDLLKYSVLKKLRVKKNIPEKAVKQVCSDYGIPFKILQDVLSEYKGNEINEKRFLKALKNGIKLPSREAFWKLLILKKVLNNEVRYVLVDNGKLSQIDPALIHSLNELKGKTFDLTKGQILLYAEQQKEKDQQQGKAFNMFGKEDFKKAIGTNKYKMLKERGVLSFNRKARLDFSQSKSITFPAYDSITLEDFTKVKITKNEAEKVLAALVVQNIIEKKDSNAYKLKTKFDEIETFSNTVYDQAIKGLLSICFAYRIALQRMEKQLKEENFPIHLQLKTKPHPNLFWDLLEQKIVIPPMVDPYVEAEDLERKLKTIYSQTMTKRNIKLMLSQDELIPEKDTEKLFQCLLEKKWIVEYHAIINYSTESVRDVSKLMDNVCVGPSQMVPGSKGCFEKIVDLTNHNPLYCINGSNERIPLNFIPEGTQSRCIDETVSKILDNQLMLSNESTIKILASTLQRSKSLFKSLKDPDCKLKSLIEFCGENDFSNIEEIHVFSLNGFDQLLQFDEMQWTRKMLLNTLAVTGIGIAQIAIGTVIELYSVGVMSHVGGAFISEGVNDIFFAASALRSGYFDWNDYRRQKLQSLFFTAATAGLGAYLSRGSEFSRFGQKLAAPNFELGQKVATMSGTRLIKTAGFKVVRKEVIKRISLKAVEGVAYGLTNVAVDAIINNCLQSLCQGIASTILSNIDQKVDGHNICRSLQTAYESLGYTSARSMMHNMTSQTFSEQNLLDGFQPIMNQIFKSISQGFGEAVEKNNKIDNTSNILAWCNKISKAARWIDHGTQLADIIFMTGRLLDKLDMNVNTKLDEMQKKSAFQNSWNQQLSHCQDLTKKIKMEALHSLSLIHNKAVKQIVQHSESPIRNQKHTDYQDFKKEMTDQWKSLLHKKAGQVIAQHLVSPILNECANRLIKFVGNRLQNTYHSYRENVYRDQFDELKGKYEEDIRSCEKKNIDQQHTIDNEITEKYHDDLLKLAYKTRDPELYAKIFRETVPMDLTCVDACSKIIPKIFKQLGSEVPGLAIIVEGDGGMRQEFSCAGDGADTIEIRLELKDKHFKLCGNSSSENNETSDSKNNCLYEAISECVPLLKDSMTPDEFRAAVASCTESDDGIRYHIEQGWHALPVSLGAYGGKSLPKKQNRRIRTKVFNDIESSSQNDHPDLNEKEFYTRVRSVDEHLLDRFLRTCRVAGKAQKFSEEFNIPANKVFLPGGSQYQDQPSQKGRGIHAAHVVRLRINTEMLENNNNKDITNSESYTQMKNFLGHTQNVERFANTTVGRSIDEIQKPISDNLLHIDPKLGLINETKTILERAKQDYISTLDASIESKKLTASQKSDIKTAIKKNRRFIR